eukprot:CAMPEP_0173440688 /NCGR_PEP_ID=MMETSP1357-20121228/23404_1 /TAXON_ID=77926 /ORGANISM="Hemiselmis rufescens, Strain PCC563" /LENGTH=285 /DNA_ID=CAMNT_0014406213 /DNA_START=18 /DNA_END=876 /DNA_ORIENTATION=-
MGYGSIEAQPSRGEGRGVGARAVAVAALALGVCAAVAVVVLSGESGVVRGPLSLAQANAQAVQYTYVPASQLAASQMPVQYVPIQYAQQAQAAPAGAPQMPALQYVPYTAAAAQPVVAAAPRLAAPAAAAALPMTQLRIGGAGVYYGMSLAENATNGTNSTEGEEEVPEAITPPTPIEIAKALQRIQERQIQQQTYHDTLVDAQTGQPLHVPGVSGSAHNGVSGIGGIFGVGGFLGPDYPIADSVQPSGAVSAALLARAAPALAPLPYALGARAGKRQCLNAGTL